MRESFILYTSYRKHFDLLTMEQRGMLFTAIMAYMSGDTLPEMDGVTEMAFSFIKYDLDVNEEKYQNTVKARREAGKLGGRPKTNGSNEKQKKQLVFPETKGKQNNPVYVDDNDNVDVFIKEKNNIGRFSPPSVEEVREYVTEKGYKVDPETFVDFYASKGWMVGKNKMKDWRASVRTWARGQRQESTAKGKRPSGKFDNFGSSGTDWDAVTAKIMEAQ